MIPCTVYSTVCDYSDHQKLVALVESSGGKIENTEFTDKVTLYYSFRDEDFGGFEPLLCEHFSARLDFNEVEKSLIPFEI